MNKSALSICLCILSASPAFSQTVGVSGQTCSSLANTIATGYTTSFSNNQFDAARYYAYCEANQSDPNGSLSIAYAAFSLGAKYSDAQKKALCSRSYDQYNVSATSYSQTKQLFVQALNTIDKCLDAASHGWAVNYQLVTKDAVTLTISNGNGAGGKLLGVDIIPDGTLQCKPALPSSDTIVTSSSPISATCSRNPTTQVIDGISVTSAPEAAINLRLAEGPFPIQLPGYSTSMYQQLNEKITDLSKQFQDYQKENTKALEDRISLLKSGSDHFMEPQYNTTKQCPAGTVLAGLSSQLDGGGPHGITSWIGLICRDMK